MGLTKIAVRGARQHNLKNISLEIPDRQFVCIAGPSGSGKSTLLRVMMGLLPPTSGAVVNLGRPLNGVNLRAAIFLNCMIVSLQQLPGC